MSNKTTTCITKHFHKYQYQQQIDAISRTLWNKTEVDTLMNAWRDEFNKNKKNVRNIAWIKINQKVRKHANSSKTLDQCKRKVWNQRKLYFETKDQVKKQQEHVAAGGTPYVVFKPLHFDIFDEVLSEGDSPNTRPSSVPKGPMSVDLTEDTRLERSAKTSTTTTEELRRKQGLTTQQSQMPLSSDITTTTSVLIIEKQQQQQQSRKVQKRRLEESRVKAVEETTLTTHKQPKISSNHNCAANHLISQQKQNDGNGRDSLGTLSNKKARKSRRAGNIKCRIDSKVVSAAAASIDTIDLDLYFDSNGQLIPTPGQSPAAPQSPKTKTIKITKSNKRPPGRPPSSKLIPQLPNPKPNEGGVKLLLPPKPIIIRAPTHTAPVVLMDYQ